MFDLENIRENVIAALATVLLTATAVGAAVGPARAVETAPVVYAEAGAQDLANA